MNVDIIVATYKRYDLLQETLKSVTNQSYPYWKCWIAEDGESKETYEAVKPFLQDNRFAYLPGMHAGYPAIPRNRGIRQGTAPYIASLDDDAGDFGAEGAGLRDSPRTPRITPSRRATGVRPSGSIGICGAASYGNPVSRGFFPPIPREWLWAQ